MKRATPVIILVDFIFSGVIIFGLVDILLGGLVGGDSGCSGLVDWVSEVSGLVDGISEVSGLDGRDPTGVSHSGSKGRFSNTATTPSVGTRTATTLRSLGISRTLSTAGAASAELRMERISRI